MVTIMMMTFVSKNVSSRVPNNGSFLFGINDGDDDDDTLIGEYNNDDDDDDDDDDDVNGGGERGVFL